MSPACSRGLDGRLRTRDSGLDPRLPTRDSRRSGFTLIEVLVALVVVTAGLTIISQGFLTGGRASLSSQNGTKAAWLAESKMAEVEAGIVSTQSSGSGTFEPEQPDFSWSTEIASTATTGLNQVTLTVTWKERNEERTFVLVRLMKERSSE